jgi:hypothetical protein
MIRCKEKGADPIHQILFPQWSGPVYQRISPLCIDVCSFHRVFADSLINVSSIDLKID